MNRKREGFFAHSQIYTGNGGGGVGGRSHRAKWERAKEKTLTSQRATVRRKGGTGSKICSLFNPPPKGKRKKRLQKKRIIWPAR